MPASMGIYLSWPEYNRSSIVECTHGRSLEVSVFIDFVCREQLW